MSNIKQKKHIILGFSSDKDLNNIFSKIRIDANFYFCASKNPRVLNPNDYLDKIIPNDYLDKIIAKFRLYFYYKIFEKKFGCNYKILKIRP